MTKGKGKMPSPSPRRSPPASRTARPSPSPEASGVKQRVMELSSDDDSVSTCGNEDQEQDITGDTGSTNSAKNIEKPAVPTSSSLSMVSLTPGPDGFCTALMSDGRSLPTEVLNIIPTQANKKKPATAMQKPSAATDTKKRPSAAPDTKKRPAAAADTKKRPAAAPDTAAPSTKIIKKSLTVEQMEEKDDEEMAEDENEDEEMAENGEEEEEEHDQEVDAAETEEEVKKKKQKTWKNLHSKIYHSTVDKAIKDGKSIEAAKSLAKETCASAKIKFQQGEDVD